MKRNAVGAWAVRHPVWWGLVSGIGAFLVVLTTEDSLSASAAVGGVVGFADWLMWRPAGWGAQWYVRGDHSN